MFMKIRRSDLQRFDEPQVLRTTLFDIGVSDLGNPEAPVEVKLIVHQQGDDLLVQGKLHAVTSLVCDRCLSSTSLPIEGEFSVWLVTELVPESNDGEEELISFPAHQKEVDISDIISRTIYLELPKKTLCREDCQGLCPVCGIDLNQNTCDCKSEEMDERWSALLPIKQKLEE
jgi:uncharacterized protein